MTKKSKKHQVCWFNWDAFPGGYAFCPSPEAWKEVQRKFDAADMDYPSTHGRCVTFEHPDFGAWSVITIIEGPKRRGAVPTIALIAHECTHAFEALCRNICEHQPSEEFRCYHVQRIVADIVQSFNETRRKVTT